MVMLLGEGQRSVRFPCANGVPVTDAALSAGYRLTTVCERGGCGSCRATLVSGRLTPTGPVSVTKTVAAAGSSHALLCRATPVGDVVLRPLKGWRKRARSPLSALLGPR